MDQKPPAFRFVVESGDANNNNRADVSASLDVFGVQVFKVTKDIDIDDVFPLILGVASRVRRLLGA